MKIKSLSFPAFQSSNLRIPQKTKNIRSFSHLSNAEVLQFPAKSQIKQFLSSHPLVNDEHCRKTFHDVFSEKFSNKSKTLGGIHEDVANVIHTLKEKPDSNALVLDVAKRYLTIALQDCALNKIHVLEKQTESKPVQIQSQPYDRRKSFYPIPFLT